MDGMALLNDYVGGVQVTIKDDFSQGGFFFNSRRDNNSHGRTGFDLYSFSFGGFRSNESFENVSSARIYAIVLFSADKKNFGELRFHFRNIQYSYLTL